MGYAGVPSLRRNIPYNTPTKVRGGHTATRYKASDYFRAPEMPKMPKYESLSNIFNVAYQDLLRSQGYRKQLEPQLMGMTQKQYTPDTGLADKFAKHQYGTYKSSVEEEYGQRQKSLEEFMSRRGIFYSGASERGQRELGKEKTQTLADMAEEIALQNIMRERDERIQAYSQQMNAINSLLGLGGADMSTAAGVAGTEAQMSLQAYQTQIQQQLAQERMEFERLKLQLGLESEQKKQKSSFWNSLLSAAGTAGGFMLGGPAGAAAGSQLGRLAPERYGYKSAGSWYNPSRTYTGTPVK